MSYARMQTSKREKLVKNVWITPNIKPNNYDYTFQHPILYGNSTVSSSEI
jgi:hypothetical protein